MTAVGFVTPPGRFPGSSRSPRPTSSTAWATAGRRRAPGSTTEFDLDLSGQNATVLGDGTRTYLPGTPAAGDEQAGAWYSALTDQLGSPVMTVSQSGVTSTPVHYDPYGVPPPGSADPPDPSGHFVQAVIDHPAEVVSTVLSFAAIPGLVQAGLNAALGFDMSRQRRSRPAAGHSSSGPTR